MTSYRWCADCDEVAYWRPDVPGYFHLRDADERPSCRYRDGMIPNDMVRGPGDECGYQWRGLFARLRRHVHRCGRTFAHDADAFKTMHICARCASTHYTKRS